MRKFFKNNRGIALATVLIVFAVVSILGVTVAGVAVSEARGAANNEKTTDAYYLARSAVDIVAGDLETRIAAVSASYHAISAAPNESKQAAIAAYQQAKNDFEALGLLPGTLGSSTTVRLSGIEQSGETPVTVSRKTVKGKECVVISCTVTVDGKSSTCKAMVGSLEEKTADVVFTTTSGPAIPSYSGSSFQWSDDAVYTWGNAIFGKTPVFTEADSWYPVSAKDMITAGGDAGISKGGSGKYDLIAGAGKETRDIPIIAPPTSLPAKTSPNLSSGGTKYLTSANNGIYPAVSNTAPGSNVTWSVDTSAGDVIIVVPSISIQANFTIYVRGDHRFYLYIQEQAGTPTARTLFYVGKTFEISDSRSIFDVTAEDEPPSAIIIYNDYLQQYYATKGLNTVSVEDAAVMTKFDKVVFEKNNNIIEAYLYMPLCDVSMKNSNSFKGAVAAGSLTTFEGSAPDFYFRPFPDDGVFSGLVSDDEAPDGGVWHWGWYRGWHNYWFWFWHYGPEEYWHWDSFWGWYYSEDGSMPDPDGDGGDIPPAGGEETSHTVPVDYYDVDLDRVWLR